MPESRQKCFGQAIRDKKTFFFFQMLSGGAIALLNKFGLQEDQVEDIEGTGPLYFNKRWISRKDVSKYIIEKQFSIKNLTVSFVKYCRYAYWFYEQDPLFQSKRSAYNCLKEFTLRPYQKRAMESCFTNKDGEAALQSCIIQAYCAAGKTYVGSAIVSFLKMPTVVITTHCVSVQQWYVHFQTMGIDQSEIFVMGDETIMPPNKYLPAITITTYNMFANAYSRESSQHYMFCLNLQLFESLLILDEVHSASATTYQAVFAQRSICIIGLTATLCREDDGISKLFKHIGPVNFSIDANLLVNEGFISGMNHIKVLIPLESYAREKYIAAKDSYTKQNLSIVNPNKFGVLLSLLYKHSNCHILVFCDIIDSIHLLYEAVCRQGIRPIGPITGQMSKEDRMLYFEHFEKASTACLFLSKVGDNAVDLKSANVIIKMSTISRSRNQEEQRNGRGARKNTVSDTTIYTLVTKETQEDVFFARRNDYLYERGFDMEYIDLDVKSDEEKLQICEWRMSDNTLVDTVLQKKSKNFVSDKICGKSTNQTQNTSALLPKKRGRPRKIT